MKQFQQHVGPTCIVPPSASETFFLFFTTGLLQLVVDETNRYAAQCMGEKFEYWELVTVDELKAYLGFMILMGVVRLPSIADYWKTDDIFHYAPIASRISKNRFFDIQRYLHFTDNLTLSPRSSPQYDKLGKIRPIIKILCKQFSATYNLHREVSVDEAMIPFKGCSTMKQYMPKKPVRRGLKVWTLADAHNGYVSTIDVYTGRKGDTTEHSLGARVVKDLCTDLSSKYHHVYFDNFFSSPALLRELKALGIYACGTLRSNRKDFPKDIKPYLSKGLTDRGDFISKQSGYLKVHLWQDNRPVVIISSNTSPTEIATVERKLKDGTRTTVTCPKAVTEYNKYMGGVDQNDQLRKYYGIRLKGRKCYKYIWWFLVDVSITNAFILNKHDTNMTVTSLKDFRVSLAKELIGSYMSRKRRGRQPNNSTAIPFSAAHFPKHSDIRRRCDLCLKGKKRHETTWYCETCKVFLCHYGKDDDCFLVYHTKKRCTHNTE